jgi:hypothetical protein
MRKFRLQISVLVFLLLSIYTVAQDLPDRQASKYKLYIRGVDRDAAQLVSGLGLQTEFTSRFICTDYYNQKDM